MIHGGFTPGIKIQIKIACLLPLLVNTFSAVSSVSCLWQITKHQAHGAPQREELRLNEIMSSDLKMGKGLE